MKSNKAQTKAAPGELKQTIIFDTNVLLADPRVLFQFPKSKVIIPLTVIEELDKFKKNADELGRNSRHIIRTIDKLIAKSEMIGQITESGILLNNQALLFIEPNHMKTIPELDSAIADNRILSTTKYYVDSAPKGHKVRLLSKDANLRIKAGMYKISAEDYDSSSDFIVEDNYLGYRTLPITNDQLELLEQGKLKIKEKLNPNEYVVFHHTDGEVTTPYIAKQNRDTGYIEPLPDYENSVFGISPKNLEQQMAMDLLLDPNIPLVTITGKAGTGKTLLAIAAALSQTLERSRHGGEYTRILISRPVIPMGKDIGYLPGDIKEKMDPWMQPIYDNLEFLFNESGPTRSLNSSNKYEQLMTQGIIKVEPLMYIRGRSIPNQIFILDESQNLSKHEVKTILSRVGEGTKIILTGDPDQIDSHLLDKVSSGLSQVVERFKGSHLAGHITLLKGERSELAEAVVELFK